MGHNLSTRVLFLDGEDGAVGCRVHSPLANSTLPHKSKHGVVECATRSWLRMRNLVAVRGADGSGMIGPTDYYGNWEQAHRYAYTLSFSSNSWPTIHAHSLSSVPKWTLKPVNLQLSTVVCKGQWKSGSPSRETTNNSPNQVQLGNSLFPNSGVLWMQQAVIRLPNLDARGYDLSPFHAQLVPNHVPFVVSRTPLESSDDFRLIRYDYQPRYAARQVEQGGLFLEHHVFSQTITPMTPDCQGFVTLAIRTATHAWRLIAISIPYGWTLIIHPHSIHGDATLSGSFLMGMTSNHVTMSTADTVFLKHRACRHGGVRNVSLLVYDHHKSPTRVASELHHLSEDHKSLCPATSSETPSPPAAPIVRWYQTTRSRPNSNSARSPETPSPPAAPIVRWYQTTRTRPNSNSARSRHSLIFQPLCGTYWRALADSISDSLLLG